MKISKIKARKYSYGGTRSLSSVKAIVIHNTGISGDTAKGEGNYFAKVNTRSAGAHYFVDRKGNIVESVPIKYTAWSVGGFFTKANGAGTYYKKLTNYNTVSIELCDIVKSYPSSAQVKAVKWLVAYIQKKCPNAKKIVRHWDVNGKTCPIIMSGKDDADWKKFKKAITATSTVKKTTTYKVKVTADSLNVRSGAGTSYPVVDKVKKGEVYTIVDASKGWGKLKSGAGWIKLSYTQKL